MLLKYELKEVLNAFDEISDIEGAKQQKNFLVRDFYQTAVLKVLADIDKEYPDVTIIFHGGTALSKAHRLLNRGSEDIDIDMILHGYENPHNSADIAEKAMKRRLEIIDEIRKRIKNLAGLNLIDPERKRPEKKQRTRKFFETDEAGNLQPVKVKWTDSNNFLIEHPGGDLIEEENIQKDIKMDVIFKEESQIEPYGIKTIGSEIERKLGIEDQFKMKTTDVVNIIGNKLSAGTWRYLLHGQSNDRKQSFYQPKDMRHMHDLADLYAKHVKQDKQEKERFMEIAIAGFKEDMENPSKNTKDTENMTIKERLIKSLELLKTQEIFEDDYNNIIANFPKIDHTQKFPYQAALENYQEVIKDVLEYMQNRNRK